MDKIKVICKKSTIYFNKADLNDYLLSLEKNSIININDYYDLSLVGEAIKSIKDKNIDFPSNITNKLQSLSGTKTLINEIMFMLEYKIKPQKSFLEYLNMIDYERFSDNIILKQFLKIKNIIDSLTDEEKKSNETYYKTFSENLKNIISEIKLGIYDYDISDEFENFLENKINNFTQHLYDTVSLTKEIEKIKANSFF